MELLALLSFLFVVISNVLAIGQKSTINFDGHGCSLAEGGSSVQIMVDQNDWPAVLRVADDLAMDFGRVTGANGSVTLLGHASSPAFNASMIYNVTGKKSFAITASGKKGGVIIAGVLGKSAVIDGLIKSGRIDVSAIKGKWEAYVSALVSNPMPGVSEALVIAGDYFLGLLTSSNC